MKKYLSLIGLTAIVLLIGRLWYQALFAYLAEHTYYFWMLSSGQNRWVFISALICAWTFPILYLLTSKKLKIRNLIIRFIIWSWIFGLIHSNIKWDPIWFWNIITVFNTILLVSLWTYLILWFSALWSRIERKLVKFEEFRWQEIFLSFWIWFCSFVIIVQILLWIWILYRIVSRILFLWLGFMIRYERKQLWKQWEILWDILEKYRAWFTSWTWNLNSKDFWNWKKIWFLIMSLPIILSLAYVYLWIQNAFTPYSTARDANHEYMHKPKILAENAGIYRWNDYANTMTAFWNQFITFIFSLTNSTNWWFWLSPDNIAISMNNLSAIFTLIFWIAIIFQAFSLLNNKKEKDENEKSELKKWKNTIVETEIKNWNWINIWWHILLLWLTGWMWAFIVIVDNKSDLWVMALSSLALLAGLIFIQKKVNSKSQKEILKYILIAWLFFWFAALAKITAFVDLVLFGLLLIWLRFSCLTSLGLWIMMMWIVRKFNILTSSVMLTSSNATWLIIIWWIITIIWLCIHLSKSLNRKNLRKDFKILIILGIWFIIPLILFKLPRTIISQIITDDYSIWNSLKSVFLSIDTNNEKNDYNKFLAQNIENDKILNSENSPDYELISSIEQQDKINNFTLNSKRNKTFNQCASAGNIYSEEELNEWIQEVTYGWNWWEDYWRYIWFWRKEFTKTNIFSIDEDTANKKWFKFFKFLRPKSNECNWLTDTENIICEKNTIYSLMKTLWPTSDTCYGFNHDAKVLCNNATIIDSFKIDDLRAIYDNWIKNKEWEAWLLLKQAIDAYNKAKSEWKLWFWVSYTTIFHDEIVNLRQYYQSHSIASNKESINIPYRYLVPLNISLNWSLQNLSSYYTDIGFFWIIVYALLLISLIYAIIKKEKVLISSTLTTLIWWGIRWIIWSAILRYGTALISRTIISLAIFRDKILHKEKDKNPKIIPQILIIIVWVFFWIQIIFNFLRIASQWASWVFVRYKWNVGNIQMIDDNLNTINKTKYWYTQKNIFDLQFPQYNPIINALTNRKNEDWIEIAWTYIMYFLWNQWYIKDDGFLLNFLTKTSDWDLCKSYRRLKNDNIRYIIVDPNIWTVAMWEWNESLFYKFFGKITNNKIEKDGWIITFIKLNNAWYLHLLSTNNLWSKYAFTLDDNVIRSYFGENLTDEELILTRWKMAVLQYFDDANSIFWSIAGIFISRIMNDTKAWLEDIANIYWLEIDSEKTAKVATSYINWQASEWFAKDLTQDERTALITYVNLYLWYKQWWEGAISSQIQNLLLSSVTWWSQIIALELN